MNEKAEVTQARGRVGKKKFIERGVSAGERNDSFARAGKKCTGQPPPVNKINLDWCPSFKSLPRGKKGENLQMENSLSKRKAGGVKK